MSAICLAYLKKCVLRHGLSSYNSENETKKTKNF